MAKRSVSRLLYLNSKDAYFNNAEDYVFPLSEPVRNVDKIRLASVNICWSWLTVDTANDLIEFVVQNGGGGVRQARLTHANYTPSTLAAELARALKAAEHNVNATTWYCTYNTANNKLTLMRENIIEDGICTIFNTSTAKSVIGFVDEQHLAMGSFVTMPNGVDLLPVKEIDIRLPMLVKSYESTHTHGNTDDLTAIISLAGYKPFDFISGEITYPSIPLRTHDFNTLTVSITNYDGYTPEFDVNVPFSLCFELTCIE